MRRLNPCKVVRRYLQDVYREQLTETEEHRKDADYDEDGSEPSDYCIIVNDLENAGKFKQDFDVDATDGGKFAYCVFFLALDL